MSQRARAARRHAGSGAAVNATRSIGAGSRSKEVILAEAGQRPKLSEDDRDDARQVLALATAAIQRERGAADGFYLRGRNFFAISSALFAATQAAFVASVGRESAGEVLLSSAELSDVLKLAAGAGAALVICLVLLILWLDRPRKMDLVGADELRSAWIDETGQHHDVAVLDVLALRAIQEEEAWASSNVQRGKSLKAVALAAGFAALLTLGQLIALYSGLT